MNGKWYRIEPERAGARAHFIRSDSPNSWCAVCGFKLGYDWHSRNYVMGHDKCKRCLKITGQGAPRP